MAGLVTGVAGLDNEPHFLKPGATPAAPPSPGFVNARPCSSYFGQLPATFQADGKTPLPKFNGKTLPYAVCGYTPKQFRNAYGLTPRQMRAHYRR